MITGSNHCPLLPLPNSGLLWSESHHVCIVCEKEYTGQEEGCWTNGLMHTC
jgi:hypothetical protein